jgi:hypothetical protein
MRILLYILALTALLAWMIGKIRFETGGLGYLVLIIGSLFFVLKFYDKVVKKKLKEMDWPFV